MKPLSCTEGMQTHKFFFLFFFVYLSEILSSLIIRRLRRELYFVTVFFFWLFLICLLVICALQVCVLRSAFSNMWARASFQACCWFPSFSFLRGFWCLLSCLSLPYPLFPPFSFILAFYFALFFFNGYVVVEMTQTHTHLSLFFFPVAFLLFIFIFVCDTGQISDVQQSSCFFFFV